MTDQAPHREFGRRAAPTPKSETTSPSSPRPQKMPKDPELAAWNAARAGIRYRTWAMCGLIVVGGPLSFLLPDGLGQIAGLILCAVVGLAWLSRFRKPAVPPQDLG